MKQFPLAKPLISSKDISSVMNVLRSKNLSRGPIIKEFETLFCQITNTSYASAVSSGTAGLIVALQALGVKAGDEVITTSFTVPATVNCIVAIGASPILVDIEEKTFGMDPNELENSITKKTKAIIIVHVFGKAAQTEKLIQIAKENNIKVIEDACEAIGNTYQDKPLGSFADIGVFAFYPNKQITTGEGGMIVTNNFSLFENCELLKNHGRSMNGDLYDQVSFGWNFRMSEINAALGLSQLKRIKNIITKRQKISQYYHNALSSINYVKLPSFSRHEINSAWFVYVIQIESNKRNYLFKALTENNIQCARYFAPVHRQPYYINRFKNLNLINTENIASQCIALPFYLNLSNEDVKYIALKIKKSII